MLLSCRLLGTMIKVQLAFVQDEVSDIRQLWGPDVQQFIELLLQSILQLPVPDQFSQEITNLHQSGSLLDATEDENHDGASLDDQQDPFQPGIQPEAAIYEFEDTRQENLSNLQPGNRQETCSPGLLVGRSSALSPFGRVLAV